MKNIYRFMAVSAVLLLLSLTAFAVAKTKFFPDVEKGSWYESSVNNVVDMGIMKGYTNGNFGPNDKVSRAELAKVLDTYNQSVVAPLKYQIGRLHQNGRYKLTGASWKKYLEEMPLYPLEFALGDEGAPSYDKNENYFDKIPSYFTVAYDDTKGTKFGMKIIAFIDWNDWRITSPTKAVSPTWFYIWMNNEFSGRALYGFFYDDVNRLIKEISAT